MQMDSRSSHPRIRRGRASERCERSERASERAPCGCEGVMSESPSAYVYMYICMYIFIYIDIFNTLSPKKSKSQKIDEFDFCIMCSEPQNRSESNPLTKFWWKYCKKQKKPNWSGIGISRIFSIPEDARVWWARVHLHIYMYIYVCIYPYASIRLIYALNANIQHTLSPKIIKIKKYSKSTFL